MVLGGGGINNCRLFEFLDSLRLGVGFGAGIHTKLGATDPTC